MNWVQTINLSQCIPCFFLYSLKVLSLANNHLKTVPAEIFMIQKLEYLSLADNQLASINPAHIKHTHIPGKC